MARNLYGIWEFDALGTATVYPERDVAEWRVLVTLDGEPCAQLRLPHPGPGAGEAYVDATVRRAAEPLFAYRAALDRLRARIDSRPKADPPRMSCSVIVCTHRRPDNVASLLRALDSLDPAPDEVIIVDNAPGEDDCRDLVVSAGAKYVREDRIGLDHARRSGLMAATGDLVSFTDDDCMPAPHWLRRLPKLFANPSVGAVTGPAFASELETMAQVRFEDTVGFGRGLTVREIDWRSLAPPRASAIGAGANMTFRRGLLMSLGDSFPAELDAGTRTESGGDMIALYRVLAAGARIIYDPATYVLHRHRRDARLLHDGVRGYGIGLAAALTKLLVRERELGSIPAWMWLWQQYRQALLGRLRGEVGPVEQRIAWDLLRGGLLGPWAWWRTRSLEEPPPWSPPCPTSETVATTPGDVITAGHVTDAEAPAISVIIATRDRPRALARCLDALEKQQRAKDGFEIIVVDDAPEATAIIPDGLAFAVRVLRSRGAGAAAARNLGAREARGRYVLFLDDDLVAASDLLLRHQDAHAAHGASAVVIGSCLPAPVEPTLAAQSAALWWTDHYRVKSDSAALMFVDVLSGNTSLARVLFEELGGFDEAFATHRREDWEFGIRALRAGAVAIHAPEAVARHEFNLTTRRMIAATRSEGTGDALIAARWPELASSLPPVTPPPPGLLRAASRSAVLESSLVQRVSPLLLDVLEWSRARSPWYRLFNRTLEAAYARSRREAAALHGNVVTLNIPPLTVDLDKTDPIEPPAVASPMIRVRWRGRVLGTIRPVDGQWSAADLASRMLHLAGPEVWTALGRPVAAPGRRANGKWLPPGFVHAPPRHDGAGWRALDDWLRMSEAPVVVILLLANPAFDVPPGGLDVFSSPRVGLAFGAHSMGAILGPARVFSGEVGSKPSDLRRLVPEYLAVRPEMLRSIGGIDAGVVRWGGQAVVQDLTERALAAGYHVAWQDFPGSIPPHPGKVDTWRRHYWAGSVAVRRVAEAGLSGVPEFLRSVPRSRRPRSLAFHGAAFGSGVLGGLCEFLPEHFATARTAGRTMASDQPSVPSGKRRRGERGWEPGA